jgi:hypothetical protein
MLLFDCGRRSLAWLTPSQRKVRTPEGNVPRENGGTLGQKPQVTESVSENKPPAPSLRSLAPASKSLGLIPFKVRKDGAGQG